MEAAKALRSPTTPPPTATTQSPRVKPASSMVFSSSWSVSKLLLSSPWATVRHTALLHRAATCPAYSGGTPSSVTTSARRSSASSSPACRRTPGARTIS